MRTIGSSGGLYSDVSLPRSERGTRLLMDTLSALHDSLLQQVWQREADFDLSQLLPILDSVADAITEVRVEGVFEQIDLSANDYTNQCSESVGLGISEKGIALDVKASSSLSAGFKSSLSTSQKGVLRHRVHFGRLSKSLGNLSSALGGRRLWILLDEWSAIPKELQPILADLIRRSILPMNRFVVKIGAIEHRSTFQDIKIQGDYCGIELGADVSADLNLDDFMVFDNSAERAKHFFSQLIFRHSVSLAKEAGTPLDSKMTADELLAVAFTRRDVFEEYVRAS